MMKEVTEIPNESKETRILIVDDHSIVRMGIAKLLENADDLILCSEAGSVNEAIDKINREIPDLILVDLAFKEGLDGMELVRVVKKRFPKIIILVHSMMDESIYAERVIKIGAQGYIQKDENPAKLIKAIRDAVNGELILSKNIKDDILKKVLQKVSPLDKCGIDNLTDREFEIYQMIGKGLTINEICLRLNLHKQTVETHRRHIKEKLGLKNNSQLVKNAAEWLLSRSNNIY